MHRRKPYNHIVRQQYLLQRHLLIWVAERASGEPATISSFGRAKHVYTKVQQNIRSHLMRFTLITCLFLSLLLRGISAGAMPGCEHLEQHNPDPGPTHCQDAAQKPAPLPNCDGCPLCQSASAPALITIAPLGTLAKQQIVKQQHRASWISTFPSPRHRPPKVMLLS